MERRTRTIAGRLALALLAVAVVVPATPAGAARQHAMGAFFIDYVPDSLTINKGDSLTFVNTDPFAGAGHTVTQAVPAGATPRFDSGVTPFGGAVDVKGVAELDEGDYLIQCRIHPFMRAVLFVGAEARPPTETVTDLVDGFLP